jgi:hypothetical protein
MAAKSELRCDVKCCKAIVYEYKCRVVVQDLRREGSA